MPKTSLKSIIFSWLGNLLAMICFETYPLIDHIKDRIKIAIIIFLNRRKGLNLKSERENELWVKFLFPIIVHYKDDSVPRTGEWSAKCVEEDYSMSHGKGYLNPSSQGCWQLKGTFVLRILCWKWYLFFFHYFECSIFIEIMVIYPIVIRLFYFTHQSIVLNQAKVSFHFHLHNYYMYKLVSLLDA